MKKAKKIRNSSKTTHKFEKQGFFFSNDKIKKSGKSRRSISEKKIFHEYYHANPIYGFVKINESNHKNDEIIDNEEDSVEKSISETTFLESDENSDEFHLLRDINGSLKLLFILLGVFGVASLASIIYCFWTTRRSAGASSEQVPRRLVNDNNLLLQSDIDVLMLSVQNLPRCAGMERLGIPTSTIGSSQQRDESRSIRSTFPIPIQNDLIISANRQTNLIEESKTKPNSGIKTEACDSYKRCNIYTSCSINSSCPPHIPRSDGEFGRDHYLYKIDQQLFLEEKRNYIQAPPNKTIQDVPDAQFHYPISNLHNHQHPAVSLHHMKSNHSEKGKQSDKFSVFGFFRRESGNNSSSSSPSTAIKKISTMMFDYGISTTGIAASSADNAKNLSNNNIVSSSMPPRSDYNQLTETSNEIDLSGSTNLNQHSKFSSMKNTSNSKKTTSKSPSAISTAGTSRKSFTSATPSDSSSDEELKSCL